MTLDLPSELTAQEEQVLRQWLAETKNTEYPTEAMLWILQNDQKAIEVLAFVRECTTSGQVTSHRAVLTLLSDILLNCYSGIIVDPERENNMWTRFQQCVYDVLPDVVDTIAHKEDCTKLLSYFQVWKEKLPSFPRTLLQQLVACLVQADARLKRDILKDNFFANEAEYLHVLSSLPSNTRDVHLLSNGTKHLKSLITHSHVSTSISTPMAGCLDDFHNGDFRVAHPLHRTSQTMLMEATYDHTVKDYADAVGPGDPTYVHLCN